MERIGPTQEHRVWLAFCALVACVGSAWIAWVPLGGVPHVSDEISYTLQARLFAADLRMGAAADNVSMWLYPFWNNEGPMFSPFPVGWPLLLSVGERLGGAAWVNPLLCGFVPVVLYRIGRAIHDARVGLLSAVLVALSPGLWLLGGSRMAHTSVLLALGWMLVVLLERSGHRRGWLLGGIAAAYVVLARPFDAALLAGPLLAWGVLRVPRRRDLFAWLGLPLLATVFVLADNQAITGDAFRFPISDWYDGWQAREGCNRLGFGADVGCAQTLGSWGHTPAKALELAWEAAVRFDRLLLGVPGGAVLALGLAMWKRVRLGWIWVVLVVLGYALYWSPGKAYGARFWHPLYLVVPVFLAVGLVELPRRWVILAAACASFVGLSRISAELADSYWCTDQSIAAAVSEQGIDEGVLFVQSSGTRRMSWPTLGVDEFVCGPMLASGNAWLLAHPEQTSGGLQIRHALPDRAQTRAFMSLHHPGAPSWLLTQDLEEGTLSVQPLGVLAPR